MIDIATIEGSQRYKHVMRHIQATEAPASLYLEPPNFRYRVLQLALSPLRLLSQRALQLPSFLDKVLNPWRYQSSDVATVEAMLMALDVSFLILPPARLGFKTLWGFT
jgi:hypothetical protein